MNQERYNSFNQIHKGLRALLYDTALQLQQADLSDKLSSMGAITQLEEVLFLFESHAHGEDQFFNEPLEQKDQTVATLFLEEHKEDHRLSQVLNDMINQWKNAVQDQVRGITGRNLLYAYNEFIAFNLYHMNKEEIELNKALWDQYTDDEIKSTEQRLVQQVPPAKMMKYAKWMIRGINDSELSHWLSEVRVTAPAPVFAGLYQIAEKELPPTRFDTLKVELARQPTIAE